MKNKNFVKEIEKSIRMNWNDKAFQDYRKKAFTFGEVANEIKYLHYLFKKSNLKPGDKISLIGKNSTNWVVVYLATITYGAVIVPILADFKPKDVLHILSHSDSKLFFADENLADNIEVSEVHKLKATFLLEDFSLFYSENKKFEVKIDKMIDAYEIKHKKEQKNQFKLKSIENDDLAEIVYTSGTTGFSKGVKLSHRSLSANVVYAINNMELNPGDKILSFMPLAHCYACAFEFLFPFMQGCHITFLGKIPSPRILIKAFDKIKPHLILMVPLLLEKIYYKQVKPKMENILTKTLLKIPIINTLIYKKIKDKLIQVFGGRFREVVVGGAPLNPEVAKFFKEISFPYTIGYGMTECGPLISYDPWKSTKLGSVGKVIDFLDIKVDSPQPNTIVGEIMVKGDNIMDGYYKDEAKTLKTISPQGWLRTGDLGIIDEDGYIFIKGRNKNLILGPSGQNIYPEEIEAKLNNYDLINDSLVIQKENKLVGLVYPQWDEENSSYTEKHLNVELEKIRKFINKNLPSYSKISKIVINPEEFEKTPTKKIKRYLYNKF